MANVKSGLRSVSFRSALLANRSSGCVKTESCLVEQKLSLKLQQFAHVYRHSKGLNGVKMGFGSMSSCPSDATLVSKLLPINQHQPAVCDGNEVLAI